MIGTVDVELPDTLVDEEVEHRVTTRASAPAGRHDARSCSRRRGWTSSGSGRTRDHAIRAIKADLVLEAIARQEDLR